MANLEVQVNKPIVEFEECCKTLSDELNNIFSKYLFCANTYSLRESLFNDVNYLLRRYIQNPSIKIVFSEDDSSMSVVPGNEETKTLFIENGLL